MGAEDMGGIKGTAEIDFSQLQQATKSYSDLLLQVNKNMGVTEDILSKLEAAGKDAAGSINQLQAEAKQLTEQMNALDPETQAFLERAKDLNVVLGRLAEVQATAAKAGKEQSDSMKLGTIASQGLGVALGILGAQSIAQVAMKMVELGKEAYDLSIKFEGVQARAKEIYGSSFPQMQKVLGNMSQQLQRSSVDLTTFATGFASVLDSVGTSTKQVDQYSAALTKMTVNLGKAFPDKSDAEIFQILQYGIEGNVRGLRQLGIVMTQKGLQDYADSQHIRTKIKDMTDEQLVMLRTQYLMQETQKLQDAGVEATKHGTDAAKEFGAVWQDFSLALGSVVMPIVNDFFRGLGAMIKVTIGMAQELSRELLNAVSFGQYGFYMAQKQQLDAHQAETDANVSFQQQHGIGLGTARKTMMPAEYQKPEDFWADHKVGSGAAQKKEENAALTESKKIQADIDNVIKDILASEKTEAEVNKKHMDDLRAELEEKRKLGIITAEEERQLDRINNRLEYQKNKITDATDAYRLQAEEVKKLQKEVETLNADIIKQGQELTKGLEKIDDEASKSRSQKIAELLKEQQTFSDKLKFLQGLTPEEQARSKQVDAELEAARGAQANDQAQIDRLNAEKKQIQVYGSQYSLDDYQKNRQADIDKELQSLKGKTDNSGDYAQGQAIFKADDLGKIDLETQQKKKELVQEANQKQADTILKLVQANNNLSAAEANKTKAEANVIKAMDQLSASTEATFTATDTSTKLHVASQVAELAKLQASLEALANAYTKVKNAQSDPLGLNNISSDGKLKRAAGGPIFGPGGPTDDLVPAMLSNGEFVVNARAYSENRDLVQAINAGMRLHLPRFASGGAVTSSMENSHNVSVVQHFQGHEASLMMQPHMLKWILRTKDR